MAEKLQERAVEFIATSSRLCEACRRAAERNKLLSRHVEIRQLKHNTAFLQAIKRHRERQLVMVSHADEDHLVLANANIQPLVSEAFHLLLTGRDTHPDQVRRWMGETNIRSENRLHVAMVDNLEEQKLSELLGRVYGAFGPTRGRGAIMDAYLVGHTMLVRGPKHRMLRVPVASIRVLREMSSDQLRNYQLDRDGSFVYWPGTDVHLGWNQFLQAADPVELQKANQRSDDFNRRYGMAIRKTREDAGITQASVQGLTERQLRRIEQGECRATANALRHLAKAHRVSLNDYMEKLSAVLA